MFKILKNKAIWSLLFGVLIFASTPAAAQTAFCDVKNQCIHDGEKITFNVYYNVSFLWVLAGEATFTTALEKLNNQWTYHIVGDGKTYSSYDWFFKVRDKYQTWLNTETLLPVRFQRHVREGGYQYDNTVAFNRTDGYAESKGKRYATPKCVQDVLSSIFYARNIDYNKYAPGDTIPFSMFLDDSVYHIYIRYLGKDVVKTKYGKFHALKIVPLLIKGTLFKGGEGMAVWVTDDKNHLPVRVSSPIVVGSIKADMMSFENLEYPLTSLIKRK